MDDETFEAFRPIVERVAHFTAFDFPTIDEEELAQGMWVFLLEHPDVLPTDEYIHGILVRAAKYAAWDERKESLQTSAQYFYRKTDIRSLLETVFDREKWVDATVPKDAKSLKGSDGIEMSADVAWALSGLSQEDRRIIFTAYGLGDKPETKSPNSKRLVSAIDRLARRLNGYTRGRSPSTATV